MNRLSFRNLISADQLTTADIGLIFKKAKKYQKKRFDSSLKGKVIAAIFYEPSSRTFASFLSAAARLGAGIIPMQGMSFSSVAKGESFEDTVKTFSLLADILIIRHPDIKAAEIAAAVSNVPIINAGNGAGEHPTQALLDAFTISQHFKNLSKISIGMVGDLKNGRTVHSLAQLLSNIGAKKYFWISPNALKMPSDLKQKVTKKSIDIVETENLDQNIKNLDVVYMTRIQKERFDDLSQYRKYKGKYIIDETLMKKAKKNMILMHPLPRIDEIKTSLDLDPRSLYFREQIQNGLYIRMALLELLMA